MSPFARPLTVTTLTTITCLSLGACREQQQQEGVSDPMATPPELSSTAEPMSQQQEITDLQSRIEARKQTIADLGAVVAMERAKFDDNPDYDPTLLNDTLLEQEQERLEIEHAQERIEELSR